MSTGDYFARIEFQFRLDLPVEPCLEYGTIRAYLNGKVWFEEEYVGHVLDGLVDALAKITPSADARVDLGGGFELRQRLAEDRSEILLRLYGGGVTEMQPQSPIIHVSAKQYLEALQSFVERYCIATQKLLAADKSGRKELIRAHLERIRSFAFNA